MHEADLALLFIRPIQALGLNYMVTGSMAAIIYGEPRLTHDLDLVITVNTEDIRPPAAAFSDDAFYCPPIDMIAVEARREQRGHINILHLPTRFKADLYMSGRDPLHDWALQRTRELQFHGERIRVAPAEYTRGLGEAWGPSGRAREAQLSAGSPENPALVIKDSVAIAPRVPRMAPGKPRRAILMRTSCSRGFRGTGDKPSCRESRLH